MAEKKLQKMDIFISSPGDVGEERKIVSEVIEQLNSMPHVADRYMLKPLAYEKIVPAAIGESPQRTVDRYMMEADKADIFICILWSRMGTPVIDNEGREFSSGTEYEFLRAYQANQKSGKPAILLYRAMKSIPADADFKQVGCVQEFFRRFKGKDAEFKGFYCEYKDNEEFKDILRRDIDVIISKIVPTTAGLKESARIFTPSELPAYSPQLKEFVTRNRADEIAKAMSYLNDHSILLISGMGGVGKTTLARALIEERSADVPLPFWFDFSKKMDATLGDVLERMAGYMDAPGIAGFRSERREAGQDDINRLIGELQRREQLWLVFDNLETILKDDRKFRDEGMDMLFASLRGSTHNAKIIVTSRILPLLNNGESLIDALDEKRELKGLKLDFAVEYLVKNGLSGLDREKLEELANGVGGHPLALQLLIGLVKKFGVSDTIKDIGMFQKRKEDTIKKARRLFEKLAGDEKELLESISVFRKPESMAAIKAMFTERTSEDAVEKLLDKSLLETDLRGNYWLHPLIREFSYVDLKNRKEMHKLAFSYYLSFKLPEKRSNKDDVQSLVEACYHACRAGEYDEAASIIFDRNLHEDLDRWGEYRTLIELYGGLLPEDHFSDRQTHSLIIGNLGIAYRNLGQVEKAIQYYEKALAIAQEIGDRRGEGARLGNLGLAYSDIGQVEKAIQYYEKALAIAQEIGDRRGEGVRLGNLGLAYSDLGQVEKPIQYYEKALAIAQEIGDRRNEGAWLGDLGIAYSDLGQVEKAIQYYEKALAIAQEIGDRRNEGALLGNLGSAYSDLGKVEKAIEYYEKGLAIAQEIGDRRNEGALLGNLGNAYRDLGQVEKAIEYYEKGLAIAQEIGDRRNEGGWLGNLGIAYMNLGNVDKTIEYYKQALSIAQEIGDRRVEGNHLNNLGIAFKNEKKFTEALACYLLAREIYIQIKDPNLKTTESNLNKLKEELGKKKFDKLRTEAESGAEEIVRKMLEGVSARNKG